MQAREFLMDSHVDPPCADSKQETETTTTTTKKGVQKKNLYKNKSYMSTDFPHQQR